MPMIIHQNKILGDTDQLSDLSDVDITSPTEGQTLKYNPTTQKWENGEAGTDLDLSIVDGKLCVTFNE